MPSITNTIDQPPAKKKNYDFVDTIRGLSMVSIVATHCFSDDIYAFKTKNVSYWLYLSDLQFVKFGTIIFFLLAGFLLGDKFADYSAFDYLKRRFKSTFKPWIIWSLLFVSIIVGTQVYVEWRFGQSNYTHLYDWVKDAFALVYLHSSYWFIINFLICIAVLLLLKRNLYSLKLGAFLLLLTLFYSINVYFEWIEPLHTQALFGFIFFLWLGAQLHKNWNKIELIVNKTPMYLIILSVLFIGLISVAEIDFLFYNKSIDPFNSLRISNILYSLAFFFLLVKIGNPKYIMELKPRETTYGIYLIHYILVYSLLPELQRHFTLPQFSNMSPSLMFIFQFSRLLITYVITFILVLLINKTNFKWIIGR